MFDEYNANDENEETSQEIIEEETVESQENLETVNEEVVEVTDNVAEFEVEEETEEVEKAMQIETMTDYLMSRASEVQPS